MGKVMNFVSSAWGLLILLLIPAIYLVVVSSLDILKAVKEQEEGGSASNEDKPIDSERLSKISEEDRARLKNELLEQMIKEKKEGKK